MDSTLFDHKNSFGEPSRQPPKNTFKIQRPISAQVKPYNVLPSVNESHHSGHPPDRGVNRGRPTTSGHQGNSMINDDYSRNLHNGILEELEPEEEAKIIEKVNYEEPTFVQGFQKLMPRNIKVEKEKLYEDTLHLKQAVNTLKEENLKVKTKNLNLERENAKLTKTVEKMGNSTAHYGKPVESSLIAALKKQVKETKDELKMRMDEIEAMKKSIKFTKMQELEVELKVYTDENIRLKTMYEELMRLKPQINPDDYSALEERYYAQGNHIEALEREHARLTAETKHLEEENYNLQLAREQDARTAKTQQQEISRLRKQLKERELKTVPNYKLNSSLNKGKGKNEEGSRIEDEVVELKRQLEEKNKVLMQRDKNLDEMKQKLNEKISNEMKEKHSYTTEIANLKEQYNDLESKYKAVLGVNYGKEDRKKSIDRPSSKTENNLTTGSVANKSVSYELPPKGKKIKKVQLDDIRQIGYELSLRLRIRFIPLEDVLTFFEKNGPKITLGDMANILTQDPFGIQDENKAITVARFLIEPQEEENVVFDMNRAGNVKSIQHNFLQLVEQYNLLDEEEEKKLATELGEILHSYEESLKTQFMMMPGAKSGYLSSDQIAQAFEMLEIEINQDTFEYLIMNIYECTGDLNQLEYMKMFEFFETEEQHKLKEVLEMYQNEEEEMESEPTDRATRFKKQQEKEKRPQSSKAPQPTKEEMEYGDEEEYQEEQEEDEYANEEYEQDDENDK